MEHTSGTSEEQLPVLFQRGWWDAQEERALRLNPFIARVLDAHPDARRGPTTPACNGRVCFSAWRSRATALGKTLYVNQARIPFVLKDDEMARMADEIADGRLISCTLTLSMPPGLRLYRERQGNSFSFTGIRPLQLRIC